MTSSLSDAATDVLRLIETEQRRQNSMLQLIASENFTSSSVIRAMGTVLTNKYSEGVVGDRCYGGNEVIDQIEALAIERVTQLFGARFANVQPHSGTGANTAAYLALLQPGDTVLAMRTDQGGHDSHGDPSTLSGRFFNFVHYGLDLKTGDIDFDQVRALALEHRPKLIVAGATLYPRSIDSAPFRAIADEVGALFMFDMAHIAGLVAGGAHPSPVGIADVVTFTTHKTLRGPRGGCILTNDPDIAARINAAVFPGSQGGPLDHVIAAKAIAFGEALDPSFAQYCSQVISNARALESALVDEGLRAVVPGTQNHIVWIDLRSFDSSLSGLEAQQVLDRARISLNKARVPGDTRLDGQVSGVRVGSPAVTTQGLDESYMPQIASLIARGLRGRSNQSMLHEVAAEVEDLCAKFPPYPEL